MAPFIIYYEYLHHQEIIKRGGGGILAPFIIYYEYLHQETTNEGGRILAHFITYYEYLHQGIINRGGGGYFGSFHHILSIASRDN